MEPCPVGRHGAHRFEGTGLIAESGEASLTWVCRHCGAVRRVAGFGELLAPGSKDDASTDSIASLFDGWETR